MRAPNDLTLRQMFMHFRETNANDRSDSGQLRLQITGAFLAFSNSNRGVEMRHWIVFVVIAITGCGESASFNGNSGKKKPARLDAVALSATCGIQTLTVDSSTLEKSGKLIQVSGEVCPTQTSDLMVQFIIDFSGSMNRNDPSIGSGGSATCGRYQAVKSIIDRINSARGNDSQVTVNVISFGSFARTIVNEVDIAQFSPTADAICRNDDQGTNYKVAFEMANQNLSASKRSAKIVYFISDGIPNEGGIGSVFNNLNDSGSAGAGRIAAENLRRNHPEVVLNALLLKPAGVNLPLDPTPYLGQITGDPSRVRIVSEASQLAERATELLSLTVNLDNSKATARIGAKGAAGESVKIANFAQSSGSTKKWQFTTDDINIGSYAGRGQPITLTIEVPEAGSGRVHSSQIEIRVP
jgi:hypothetical protein